MTGVAEAADQLPGEMSLGMQQCVSLARALSLEPELLLLDEPFSMLDSLTRLDLQDTLLRAWEQDRKIVVMVTHDVDEALYLADRIVLMTDGPAAHVGEILTLPFARPRDRREVLEHPQYRRLRQSIIDFLENHAKQSSDPDAETVLCASASNSEGELHRRVARVPLHLQRQLAARARIQGHA